MVQQKFWELKNIFIILASLQICFRQLQKDANTEDTNTAIKAVEYTVDQIFLHEHEENNMQ